MPKPPRTAPHSVYSRTKMAAAAAPRATKPKPPATAVCVAPGVTLVSKTPVTAVPVDGDHDGKTGGEYNTWFTVANTVFVDKMAPAGGTGTVGSPYQTISAGLAAAASGATGRCSLVMNCLP